MAKNFILLSLWNINPFKDSARIRPEKLIEQLTFLGTSRGPVSSEVLPVLHEGCLIICYVLQWSQIQYFQFAFLASAPWSI